MASSRLVSLVRVPRCIELLATRSNLEEGYRFISCVKERSCVVIQVPRYVPPGLRSRAFQTFCCVDWKVPIHESGTPFLFGKSCQAGVKSQYHRFYSVDHKEKRLSESDSSSSTSTKVGDADELEQFQKLSLYERIKAMYRDYWYVLVPVHLASSVVFFGTFYYAASSGVDIIGIMETMHFSETVINKLRDSSAGYIAIAYALYKIFTPVRYTVTVGGTTWAIRFLKGRGLIRPRRPMKEAKEKMQETLSAIKLRRDKDNK